MRKLLLSLSWGIAGSCYLGHQPQPDFFFDWSEFASFGTLSSSSLKAFFAVNHFSCLVFWAADASTFFLVEISFTSSGTLLISFSWEHFARESL